MIIRKVFYKNSHWIVTSDFKSQKEELFIAKIKDARWSEYYQTWLLPYSKESYWSIKHSDIQFTIDKTISKSSPTRQNTLTESNVTITYTTKWFFIKMPKNQIDISFLRTFKYTRWSHTYFHWQVPYSGKNAAILKQYFGERIISFQKASPERTNHSKRIPHPQNNTEERVCPHKMIEKLRQLRYSESTIQTYTFMFKQFINHFPSLEIDTIEEATVYEYIDYLVLERKVSIAYQNQAINSIKFYYEKVLLKPRAFYTLDRPRKENRLPTVLNKAEMIALLSTIKNTKHETFILLGYSSGMRVSEISVIKPEHIDKKRMQIRVFGKGNKERVTILSKKMLEQFKAYYKVCHPRNYVFEGRPGKPYSKSSMEKVIKKAAQKAGIKKRVTMHTLRHTFATHCLENGVDLRYIQAMLGHESPKTTEIYTHVTTKGFDQIKSPLDEL